MKKIKKEKSNMLKNLKMTWSLTKGARKYLFGFIFFVTLLSVIGAIIPTFTAKQILYINNTLWNKLLYIAIVILIFELFRNLFRYICGKLGNMFYRETLKNIQIELAKNTLNLEMEVIDTNTSGLFIN